MGQQSAGGAPQLYEQDGEQQSHSVESNRLVSEDHSHYILIKGEGSYDDMFFSILLETLSLNVSKRQLYSRIDYSSQSYF